VEAEIVRRLMLSFHLSHNAWGGSVVSIHI
jgi:hypothetical protein